MKKILFVVMFLMMASISYACSRCGGDCGLREVDVYRMEIREEQQFQFSYEKMEVRHDGTLAEMRAQNYQRVSRRYCDYNGSRSYYRYRNYNHYGSYYGGSRSFNNYHRNDYRGGSRH
jgi:hypothetical protein